MKESDARWLSNGGKGITGGGLSIYEGGIDEAIISV